MGVLIASVRLVACKCSPLGKRRAPTKDESDPSLTAAQRVKLPGYMAVARSAARVIRGARNDRIRRTFQEHRRDDE